MILDDGTEIVALSDSTREDNFSEGPANLLDDGSTFIALKDAPASRPISVAPQQKPVTMADMVEIDTEYGFARLKDEHHETYKQLSGEHKRQLNAALLEANSIAQGHLEQGAFTKAVSESDSAFMEGVSSRSTARAASQAYFGLGASVADSFYRITGQSDKADEITKNMQMYRQAMSELSEGSAVEGAFRGASESVFKFTTMGRFGGAVAITNAIKDVYFDSVVEAKRDGKTEDEARKYALASAANEGFWTVLFQSIGAGGMEKVLLKGGVLQGVRQAVKQLAFELLEENLIEAQQLAIDKTMGMAESDASLLTKEGAKELAKTAAHTTLTTMMAMGMAQGQQKFVDFADRRSRRTAEKLGLPDEYISGPKAKEKRNELFHEAQRILDENPDYGKTTSPEPEIDPQTPQTTTEQPLENTTETAPHPETPSEAEFEPLPESDQTPAQSPEPPTVEQPDPFSETQTEGSEQPFSREQNNSGKRSPLELQNPADVFAELAENGLVDEGDLQTLREFAAGDIDSFEGVVNESIRRSNEHNIAVEALKSDFRERFGDNHASFSRKAKVIAAKGGDPHQIPHFDEIVDEVRNRPESPLFVEADKLGQGDIEAGLFEILQGGIRQFEKVQPEEFLGDVLSEAGTTDFDFGANVEEDAPPPPPESPDLAPEQFDHNPSIMAAKNEVTQAHRIAMGLDPYPSPISISNLRQQQNAIANGIPERATEIAAQIIADPTTSDAEIEAGLNVRNQELKIAYNQALAENDTAKKTELLDEIRLITSAINVTGTELGRAFQQRKFAIDEDLSPAEVLIKAEKRRGKPPTKKQSQELEAMAKKLLDAEAKLKETQEKLENELAYKSLSEAYRARGPRGKKQKKYQLQTLNDRAKELLQAGCAL